MSRSGSAPIAPISWFPVTHTHKGVIPAVGAIGANRRSEHYGASPVAVTPGSDEQNTAYRNGLCIDCRTVRYSAGRPRCNGCHDALASRMRPATPGRTGPHSPRPKGKRA